MELTRVKRDEVARVCAALGHSLRLEALSYLISQPHGGAYVSDMVLHFLKQQVSICYLCKEQ